MKLQKGNAVSSLTMYHHNRIAVALGLVLAGVACSSGRTETQPATETQPGTETRPSGRYTKPSNAELRRRLTGLQYRVTQQDDTEPPFNNLYWDNHKPGIYVDVVSGEPLFSSLDKFNSRTGWPSFTRPLVPENIVTKVDYKLLAPRTEVRSKHADSHLGHVFRDGPKPTGLRYCMNSASLRFVPVEELEKEGYGKFLPLFKGR